MRIVTSEISFFSVLYPCIPKKATVPDAAIMICSGLGPKEEAQEKLSVGVGTLAGSTIMVLTVPWGISILCGRVDLTGADEIPNYYGRPKLSYNTSLWKALFKTGIQVTPPVNNSIKVMILTTIPYLIIEIGLLILPNQDDLEEVAAGEKNWAIVGLICCMIGFIMYIKQQFGISKRGEDEVTRLAVMKKLLGHGTISLRGALYDALKLEERVEEESKIKGTYSEMIEDKNYYSSTIVIHYLDEVLKEPFAKYDRNGDGKLDKGEVLALFVDLKEDMTVDMIDQMFSIYYPEKNELIDYRQFCEVVYFYIKKNFRKLDLPSKSFDDEGFGNQEEHEEIPRDLAHLRPEQQQFQIKLRSAGLLFVGAILVAAFSDPTVDVVQEIAGRMGLSPFYVSFILLPFATNASELIASTFYSRKKTSKSMTVSLSSLCGACSMNNTLCLMIFMSFIVFRGIAWEYTAETVAIIVVQIAVGFLASRPKQRMIEAFVVFSLHPLSILLVALLEHLGLK